LESGSKDELEAKTKDLSEAIQKVGAAMYEAQKTEPKKEEDKSRSDKSDRGSSTDKSGVQEGEVVNE